MHHERAVAQLRGTRPRAHTPLPPGATRPAAHGPQVLARQDRDLARLPCRANHSPWPPPPNRKRRPDHRPRLITAHKPRGSASDEGPRLACPRSRAHPPPPVIDADQPGRARLAVKDPTDSTQITKFCALRLRITKEPPSARHGRRRPHRAPDLPLAARRAITGGAKAACDGAPSRKG